MPTLNFAFGVGNFFNFTFNLRLGNESAPPTRAEPVQSRDLDITPQDCPAKITPSSTSDDCDDGWATSEEQLVDLIQSAIPHSQSLPPQASTQDAESSDGRPILPISGTATTSQPSVNSIRRLPRTPKSRSSAVPHLIPRRRSRSKTFLFSSVSQKPGRYPLQPRLPSPRSLKPLGELLPTPPGSDTPCTPCTLSPCFQRLPLEIKNMIYRELLVSREIIKKPHRLVCNKRSIMLDSIQPITDIDSSILRVCRSVYTEALPVLYGQNTFEFTKPRKLRDFSHGYLEKRVPKFAFREAQAGRFTLIRSVILRLGYDRKPYAFQRPPGVAPAAPDRKRIWSHWHQYFFNDNDSRNQYDWGWLPTMGNEFPALDKIELDFTEWQLSDVDAIRVEPFVAKLRKSGGLSSVTIKGIKNSLNLTQLQRGLVKPGGSFTSMN